MYYLVSVKRNCMAAHLARSAVISNTVDGTDQDM